MANQRRILPVLLPIAVAVTALWLLLRTPPEPVYQGRPLTSWLDGRADEITSAVQQIGTNAIPTLLRLLDTRDSKFKLKLIQLSQKQHLINLGLRSTDFRRFEAKYAFTILGSRGQSAVPALLKIYRERRHGPYDDPRGIAEIFAAMGPAAADAVPQLAHDTTDPDLLIRLSAIQTLGSIHSQPGVAVPALTSSLRDPSVYARASAAFILSFFGNDAQPAVPELIKLLADPATNVKTAAAYALKQIDPSATAQAGVQ